MKYHILHVVHSLEIGGAERVVVNLVNHLDRELFRPFVCCITRAGELARDLAEPDSLSVLGHEGRITPGAMYRLGRIVRENRIDLIHSHNLPGLLYSYAAAKLLRLPLVHTRHGQILWENSALLSLIEKWMSRSVDAYVCVSEQLEREVRSIMRVRPDRLAVVYNGIEPSPLGEDGPRRDHSTVVVGSVGRLAAVKNYELLVRAFAKVRERFPDSRLELVGDGDRRSDLLRLIEALSLGKSAVLHGAQADVSRYLDRFDIFVLPSFSEGHAISLLEALNLGRVCLASNVGGNAEIIEDGVNGFLFRSNDLDGLTETLLRLIEGLESADMDRVRTRAKETVRSKFSLEAMRTRYEELYLRFLAGRRRAQPEP